MALAKTHKTVLKQLLKEYGEVELIDGLITLLEEASSTDADDQVIGILDRANAKIDKLLADDEDEEAPDSEDAEDPDDDEEDEEEEEEGD